MRKERNSLKDTEKEGNYLSAGTRKKRVTKTDSG